MTELEERGYAILLGQDTTARSYNEHRAAIEAAHRHAQLYEIPLFQMIRDLTWMVVHTQTDAYWRSTSDRRAFAARFR